MYQFQAFVAISFPLPPFRQDPNLLVQSGRWCVRVSLSRFLVGARPYPALYYSTNSTLLLPSNATREEGSSPPYRNFPRLPWTLACLFVPFLGFWAFVSIRRQPAQPRETHAWSRSQPPPVLQLHTTPHRSRCTSLAHTFFLLYCLVWSAHSIGKRSVG